MLNKCKVCGRNFKSEQALGGHMSSAHPSNPVKPAEAPDGNHNTVEPEADEDPGIGEQIRGYIAQGYDFVQLTKKFGFDPRSVRREAEKVIEPNLVQEEERGDYLPDTYKQTDVMNPEAIMRRYTDGSYEDELELRGMMKLRGAMLMVLDLATIQERLASAEAKRLDPLLKVLREGRDELDAAAARARDSSTQIAHEAAFEVAQGMKGAFSAEVQELKAALPGKPDEMNPLAKMFFGAMQPYAGQAIGQMFSSIFKMPVQGGAQPQGEPQPVETPGQPTQPATADTPPVCMRPGEENEFQEL